MRVLIVDGNNEDRRLLRQMLEEQQDSMMVAEASDGDEGVRLAQEFKPDLILMDMDMPGVERLQALPHRVDPSPGFVNALLSALLRIKASRIPPSEAAG
jgi:CheY-like chemotaxis protein